MAFDTDSAVVVEDQPIERDTGSIDVLAQIAHTALISVPQLLDMPSHVINLLAEKAGIDFRMPANMEQNFKENVPGGEGDFMNEGWPKEFAKAGGTAISFGMGAIPVSRAPSAVSLGADIVGIGSTTAGAASKVAAPEIAQLADANLQRLAPGAAAKNEAERAVMAGEGDATAAGFRFDPESAKVVPDAKQQAVIDQDFDPGVVSMVSTSTPTGRANMIEMVNKVKKNRINKRKSASNRASDIPGRSLSNRVKAVRNINTSAGQQLDAVAGSLKGKDVDFAGPMENFGSGLESMGIVLRKGKKGKAKAHYKDSALKGLPGLQRVVNTTIEMIQDMGKPDAYALHQLKRYLDEQISYGKVQEGLSGKTESLVRGLRADIDGLLDGRFPEYDRVNTQYSESIQALDNFQKSAGRSIDLTGPNADKALGVASRKLLSNQMSRQTMADAIAEMERVIGKYKNPQGTVVVPYKSKSGASVIEEIPVDDDLEGQIVLVSELERMFGTDATQSFMGIQSKAMERAVGLIDQRGNAKVGTFNNMLKKWSERSKSEEAGMQALLKLLGEDQSLIK